MGVSDSEPLTGYSQDVSLGCSHLTAWLGEDLPSDMPVGRSGWSSAKLAHVAISRLQILTGFWPKTSGPYHMNLFTWATHSRATCLP